MIIYSSESSTAVLKFAFCKEVIVDLRPVRIDLGAGQSCYRPDMAGFEPRRAFSSRVRAGLKSEILRASALNFLSLLHKILNF